MLKNTEGKEVDAFEQALEYRIANIKSANTPRTADKSYLLGLQRGFEYALKVYRECREAGTQ